MQVDFSAFNWLALIALLPLGVVIWRWKQNRNRPLQTIVAVLLCFCLFGALAGVLQVSGTQGKCRLFLLDHSGSALPVESAIRARFLAELAQAREDDSGSDLVAVILYGRDSWPAVGPLPLDDPGLRAARVRFPERDGTDINAAVIQALALVPEGYQPELTIIGDGFADGGAVTIPADISRRYISVPAPNFDAALVRLRVPETASLGETVSVDASVWAAGPHSARGPLRGVVRLYDAVQGAIIDTIHAPRLTSGMNHFRFSLNLVKPGRRGLLAEVAAEGDVCQENDSLRTRLEVTDGKASRLLAAGQTIPGLGAEVRQITARELRTMSLEQLSAYQAVLLHNMPFKQLGVPAALRLTQYVTALGGGLMVTGPDRVFGPGGYAKTPLEKILPLSSRPREASQTPRRIMIAVDRSGSMADDLAHLAGRKIDAAKAAALAFILQREEEEHTRIGLMFFSAETEVIKRPVEAASETALKDRLKSLDPHGGTRIVPALRASLQILREETQSREEDLYIFILSDGLTREEIDPDALKSMTAELKELGVQLLTLQIGRADAGPLQQVTEQVGGTFQALKGTEDIIVGFEHAADRETGDYFVTESGTAVPGPGALVSRFPMPARPLSFEGYIRASLQDNSLLVLKNGGNDDPLAALRYAGLGRTAAAAGVQGWFADALRGNLLSWTAGNEEGGSSYTVEIRPEKAAHVLSISAAGPIPVKAQARAVISIENEEPLEIPLIRQTPESFGGRFSLPPATPEFSYAVKFGDILAVSGHYLAAYPQEYDPRLRQAVTIQSGPALGAAKHAGRGYVPFALAFLILFAAYEIMRFIREARSPS